MPTSRQHPGRRSLVRTALIDVTLFLFPWAHHHLPEPRPHDQNNFATRRIAIASAICIRERGAHSIDEQAEEVDAWLVLTRIPYKRRLLLIQAGVPVTEAAGKLDEWDDDMLRAMVALNRMAAP